MSNYIVSESKVPVNGGIVGLSPRLYAVALEWAQRTEQGERLGLCQVFDVQEIREIGAALELIVKDVLVGSRDGGFTMPQVTRRFLLGGGR
jgi:hypothetical protein